MSGDVASLPSGISMRRAEEGILGVLGREANVDAPVLDGGERADLPLPIDDQAQGDRLHAAGRESGTDLLPQDRGDAVADEPIEDPPRLLRLHELEVDRAGVLERLENRVLGDLGERDPLGAGGGDAEDLGDVEGDRLALAVVVGREDQIVRPLLRRSELSNGLLARVGHDVLGLEPLFGVDAQLALRQVADVPVGGPNRVVTTQVSLQGLRLRGRLHDDQRFRHEVDSFTGGGRAVFCRRRRRPAIALGGPRYQPVRPWPDYGPGRGWGREAGSTWPRRLERSSPPRLFPGSREPWKGARTWRFHDLCPPRASGALRRVGTLPFPARLRGWTPCSTPSSIS